MLCISLYLCYYRTYFLEGSKMELTNGVKEYLDEIVKKDTNYLVLIYGSSVTGRSSSTSDLDVFVLGTFESSFRMAVVVDGRELEINFTDILSIERRIDRSIKDNNSYYESVFNNNIVLKDTEMLVDRNKNYIRNAKIFTKKEPRRMPTRYKYLLYSLYKDLREDEDLYSYFNFLDEIRMTFAYMNNYSTLHVGKVYEMYTDSVHATRDYCLTLPREEFIHHFDTSIRNPLDKHELEYLMKSVGYDPLTIVSDCGFFDFIDNQRRKSILVHMSKLVNRTIRMLKDNNPYREYVYFVVLNHLYRFYEEIYGGITEEFLKVFNSAKTENDVLLRCEFLKQMFSLLEGKYAFDYKNYTLYFR